MRESVPPLSSRSIQRASSSFFRGEMVMPQNEAMDPLGDLTRGFREMGLSAFGALMGASTLRAPARGSPSSGLDGRDRRSPGLDGRDRFLRPALLGFLGTLPAGFAGASLMRRAPKLESRSSAARFSRRRCA